MGCDQARFAGTKTPGIFDQFARMSDDVHGLSYRWTVPMLAQTVKMQTVTIGFISRDREKGQVVRVGRDDGRAYV